MNSSDYEIRIAIPDDAIAISMLSQEIYGGTYPDPLMGDLYLLKGFLASSENVWVVAEKGGRLMASVAYETEASHRIAKVFGGVVLPEHRGSGLLERAMVFGADLLSADEKRVDIFYATTRTVTSAAQRITEKLGYKKLGIFPNVHKTDLYETHCLTALFSRDALKKRFTGFKLHPKIKELFGMVRAECDLADQEVAAVAECEPRQTHVQDVPPLEIIDAPGFTTHRFRLLKEAGELPFHFYPFHQPNLMISSPCQRVEIFVYLAPKDKYCTIVGIKKADSLDFTRVLMELSRLLREKDVRYIETIVRTDKVITINNILKAQFVPCAYFPAFQLHEGLRYDYLVLSKTFEVLDFKNLRLAGLNQKYLTEYYRQWKETFVDPFLIDG